MSRKRGYKVSLRKDTLIKFGDQKFQYIIVPVEIHSWVALADGRKTLEECVNFSLL